MILSIAALALAAAPAPQSAPEAHKDHAQHQPAKAAAPCDMPCCKDKPMPCCEKMHGEKKAEAPAADAHGDHGHAH